MNDPYLIENGVLRNKLGITDGHQLARMEAALTHQRLIEIAKYPVPGNLDFDHLCAIHRAIFVDLYDWAGTPRTIDIGKDDSRFANWRHIDACAAGIFADLALGREEIETDRTAFLELTTTLFADLNALHPHREGNGRTLRAFLDHFARAHDFQFAWEKLSRDEVIGASIFSMAAINGPLYAMLDKALAPLHRRHDRHAAAPAQRARHSVMVEADPIRAHEIAATLNEQPLEFTDLNPDTDELTIQALPPDRSNERAQERTR